MSYLFKNFENFFLTNSDRAIGGKADTNVSSYSTLSMASTNWSYESYDPVNTDYHGDWTNQDCP